MKSVLYLTLAFATIQLSCSAQITNNVLTRVLHLRTGPNETATGFTIAVDGREYLITAKHAVAHWGDDAVIGIEQDGQWEDVKFKVFRCDDPTDIAVLVPPYQLTFNLPLSEEHSSFQYGQDAYFLGFPYNMGSQNSPYGGYPLPLIKHSIVSVVIPIDRQKKGALFLMDGYNNPGFSGGPVVARDFRQSGFVYEVLAVVSGFTPEIVPVVTAQKIESPNKASDAAKEQPWRIAKKPDGTWIQYVDTANSVVLNTGIVRAFSIDPVIEVIRKHPQGPEEKTLTQEPSLKSAKDNAQSQ